MLLPDLAVGVSSKVETLGIVKVFLPAVISSSVDIIGYQHFCKYFFMDLADEQIEAEVNIVSHFNFF